MSFKSLVTAICILATASIVSAEPFAYVANSGTRNVTVIDTSNDTIVGSPIALPDTNPSVRPYAYAVTVGASGQYVYVGLQDTNEVAVIDTLTNEVVKRVGLGNDIPGGLAVNAAETRLYVASNRSDTLIVIDISGSGAAEVGRVTVDDHSISNPEGVVINAAGDKAYVANSSQGTIAEITLNEAANIYTRTSIINLGASIQPIGLALSADGANLFASTLGGSVKMIKLSDQTITSIPVGTGALGVVTKQLTPSGNRVYTASNSLDKLYVIDPDATTPPEAPTYVLASPAVTAGPWGISTTPDGAKLYIAMNLDSTVKVYDIATDPGGTLTPTKIINLPSEVLPGNAKPTSLGNFVGPTFPYTITATNGANCLISPVGAIKVNGKGRNFTIAPVTGQCEVKVDGVSVGQPTAYAITNIGENHAIDASQATAGVYYTLSANWYSAVGGYLVSTPVGINENSKSAKFIENSTVTIKASTGKKAIDWTGACASTTGPVCTLSALAADKSFGATVIDIPPGTGPVYNKTKSTYHQTLEEAIAAATTSDEIQVTATYSAASGFTCDSATATMITLSGGFTDDSFSARSGFTTIAKPLTIIKTGIIADMLSI